MHFARRLIAALALTASLLAATGVDARGPAKCETYTNSSGHQVCRPMRAKHAPEGATAKCRDGTYSFSEHHRGTCSHHGGVAEWL
jgi:hypothetical protein